ncbi:cobalt transporter [Lentzea pudingi]|uniref:Cobalt transporter n=1 Tax=Lentzea pudingi TaxID=1789439 RepID=A0ABQ2IVL5_9PSEU|nr:cation diffusion facilitator family transporter [Lentzea pudingi]GGN28955.1 cobalt transporter [Lentzea pudingi]
MAAIHDSFELPPEKAALHRRAVRLEWWTVAFFVVAITVLAAVLGQSQAMKAAWVEDILALAPPIAFLVADRYRNRPVDAEHPYGHHRSVAIAFLASALALLVLGGYILIESVLRLVQGERPPIGLIDILGHTMWLGWPMIAVLLVTMVPAILLGRAKTKLAAQLHDKVLYADAEMNRADWLTAGAAVLGIIGIGAGLWWADAVAAIIISADIVRDGLRTTRTAVADLMDRRPRTVTDNQPHPLPAQLTELALDQPWVTDAWIRLREEGHVFVGEMLVVPKPDTDDLVKRLERLSHQLRDADWRMHDIAVMPVLKIHR